VKYKKTKCKMFNFLFLNSLWKSGKGNDPERRGVVGTAPYIFLRTPQKTRHSEWSEAESRNLPAQRQSVSIDSAKLLQLRADAQ
jgi:hypothetical protein